MSRVVTACPATPRSPLRFDVAEIEEEPDYDPWQGFNELTFAFNHDVLDRFLVRPAARGWATLLPEEVRRGIGRVFDNLELPRRFTNKVLQARPLDAAREVARFTINAVFGIAGLIDVAAEFRLPASEADAGETMAMVGVGPGPYLVLPTFPPLTVRDAIGRGLDGLLNPVGYFVASGILPGQSVVRAVNQRSLNLKFYEDVEDGTLDLYSSARNAYLQRRRRVVYGAEAARDCQWAWVRGDPE